ncbi:MAG: Hint domain-containing protein [Pseudorhodobacter sp.]|nr:Hint domain-containing protein [Pseudorhodobacter sp.]
MSRSDAIVNGNFQLGTFGWSGTDLETNPENAYISGPASNRVAEMDGRSGFQTIMQQSVTVNWGQTTELTFRTALRNASLKNAGLEGFRVDVIDSTGAVIATRTVIPTTNTWQTIVIPVTFPTGGTYTVRFTELGPNDSLGAIVDDISMLVCFVAGTMIETDQGPRPVESLQVGDLVWTQDHGFQPLRWIGKRRISLAEQIADPTLRPVVISAGALGDGAPCRDLAVSAQHRVLSRHWRNALFFAEDEVLVPAKSLVNGTSIRQKIWDQDLDYVHFLFDQHEIVSSDGALTESFLPSATSLTGVGAESRAEILRLFPELANGRQVLAARPVLSDREGRLCAMV